MSYLPRNVTVLPGKISRRVESVRRQQTAGLMIIKILSKWYKGVQSSYADRRQTRVLNIRTNVEFSNENL
jgi:hypothetical protein